MATTEAARGLRLLLDNLCRLGQRRHRDVIHEHIDDHLGMRLGQSFSKELDVAIELGQIDLVPGLEQT
jgi:hypothetical protein